jgi:FG-GAP repeat protein
MRATGRAILTATMIGACVVAVPTSVAAAPIQLSTPQRIDRDGQAMYFESMSAPASGVVGHGPHKADFDGDGVDDIATSYLPNHEYIAPPWVGDGGVAVQYSRAGRTDYFNGVTMGTQGGDFGQTLATGDFNHDGYDDLVIGVPYESSDAIQAYGGIWIISGSSTGLVAGSAQHFDQDSPGVPGGAEPNDNFGFALAAGDLNGDGYADLAVGVPDEAIGSVQSAGLVNLFYGSPGGISATGAIAFDQNTAGVPGGAETGDVFGMGLAIGKINGDRYADLAVGTPDEHTSSPNHLDVNGMIDLFDGSSKGLSFSGVTSVTAAAASIYSSDGYQVQFYGLGESIEIGDIDGDGYGDVVVGTPGTDVNFAHCGAVVTFPGRSTGISSSRRQYLSASSAGVPGTTVWPDCFGGQIAVGDVTGDGRADVVVGDADYTVSGLKGAGVFWLIPGSKSGLTGTGSAAISQNTAGVPGAAEAGDNFGHSVSILNLDGRNGLDVVVGAPNEYVTGNQPDYPSGSIITFVSASGRLSASGSWSGKTLDTPDFFLQTYGTSIAG